MASRSAKLSQLRLRTTPPAALFYDGYCSGRVASSTTGFAHTPRQPFSANVKGAFA